MATVDTTTHAPLVPPITPEELKKRNQSAMQHLKEWADDEADEADQVETMEVLSKALGPDRTLGYRNTLG